VVRGRSQRLLHRQRGTGCVARNGSILPGTASRRLSVAGSVALKRSALELGFPEHHSCPQGRAPRRGDVPLICGQSSEAPKLAGSPRSSPTAHFCEQENRRGNVWPELRVNGRSRTSSVVTLGRDTACLVWPEPRHHVRVIHCHPATRCTLATPHRGRGLRFERSVS